MGAMKSLLNKTKIQGRGVTVMLCGLQNLVMKKGLEGWGGGVQKKASCIVWQFL